MAEELSFPDGGPGPRIFELTTLYEVSRTLLGSDSTDRMVFEILTSVMGLTGAEWGCLFVSGPAGLTPLRCCGRPEWARAPLPCPDRVCDALAGLQAPVRPEGPLELPHWIRRSGAEVLLPFSEGGRLQGLILLGPNRLGQQGGSIQEDLLVSVADLIGLAWSRGRRLVHERGEGQGQGVPEELDELKEMYPALRRIEGEGPEVREICARMARAARTDCAVVLEGETGTGKEAAARAIHEMSRRREGPLVAVDCGALPRGTEESELFGHVRGAFTGAVRDHAGYFEQAHRGTLFLDEVGNLPPETQQRLLRVLQERRVRPVGAEQTRNVDFRLIAASGQDLAGMVREGTFREDLYYRLYVYPIRLAPLREQMTSTVEGPASPGTERGELVLDVLRRHRFNIQAASRALENGTDPVGGSLPVSDRSTLRYYLRGEMIRAWLATDGDLGRAARMVAGPTGQEDEVRRKMVLLLESLEEMACLCEGSEELRRHLQERFRKLPADYMPVLDELGERIWQQANLSPPGCR